MTKKDLEKLKEMLNDPTIKGKKSLDRFIWINTIEPRFEIGNCFIVSDPGHRVYDVPVRNFNARITEIKLVPVFKEIMYTLTASVKMGNKEFTTTIHKNEDALMNCPKTDNCDNTINGNPSGIVESLDI